MAIPGDSQKNEQPSTYFVQDRKSEKEQNRLTIQDRLITTGMGGVLPEINQPEALKHVLDIGCGTGGWIIEAASKYPEMTLVGIDISQRMIEYARAQADAQGVSSRTEFRVMDALKGLEFANETFDLTNLRFGSSFLRTWDWANLFAEMRRVTQPGGIVRVVDTEPVQSNSPALSQLWKMFLEAAQQSGRDSRQQQKRIDEQVMELFTRYPFQQVQKKVYVLEHRAGTEAGQAHYENAAYGFQTARPFIQKWAGLSVDYDAIYQKALEEMQQPGFTATQTIIAIWGRKI